MNLKKNKTLLAVYGVGGHETQMNRLIVLLKPKLSDVDVIALSDSLFKPEWCNDLVSIDEVRSKYKSDFFGMFKRLFKCLVIVKKASNKYSFNALISTGPGISVLASIYLKFFYKSKIIHIETWSRFNSKSLTGRFMYILADVFYVQNEEALKLYPKAIYSGRL